MSHAIRIALFAACLALPAFSKGITVRFMPNPPEDSIVTYAVLRSEGTGEAMRIGEVPARPARDTFAFADSSAAKGHAYIYSIVGLDAAGGMSDPSESTEVALPSLALPDTLLGQAGDARWTLPFGADPLSGEAPLSLILEDTARFSLRYDSSAHAAVFAPRGEARSGWVTVRATYYGKFTDRDSMWLSLPAPTAARAVAGAAGPAYRVPASWSFASQGALRVGAAAMAADGSAREAGRLEIVTVRGETVAALRLPGNGSEVLWDGKDAHGRSVKPACYLWAARGPRGSLLQSGSLRLEP